MANAPTKSPKERWQMVQDRLALESATATLDDKLAQLESLMSSVDDFGWREKLGADDDRVRALWTKLRLARAHGWQPEASSPRCVAALTRARWSDRNA